MKNTISKEAIQGVKKDLSRKDIYHYIVVFETIIGTGGIVASVVSKGDAIVIKDALEKAVKSRGIKYFIEAI